MVILVSFMIFALSTSSLSQQPFAGGNTSNVRLLHGTELARATVPRMPREDRLLWDVPRAGKYLKRRLESRGDLALVTSASMDGMR